MQKITQCGLLFGESFLHPSAQAEFGKVLQDLSTNLGIQVIVSTHSPYMLNQSDPVANVLLKRQLERNLVKGTVIADTTGDHWMEPFAEHLGICPPEFEVFRALFAAGKTKVVLVEGDIDKEYLEFITGNFGSFNNEMKIEFVPYGGKDTLKNTLLLKFVLSRIEKCFITVDLDAISQVERSFLSLNLQLGKNYMPIGISKPGRQCIEGLLPDRVSSAVFGRETDLVMQLTSADSEEKRKAKNSLKRKLLDEFRAKTDYSADELKEFQKIWSVIVKAFK